jgi:hypothetical protein
MVPLNTAAWRNNHDATGHGYRLDLLTLDCGWIDLADLRPSESYGGRALFESPALIGCGFAVSRHVYDRVRGFDPDMRFWGVEDLDFGLKCWLLGYPILHDPDVLLGHRFRDGFDYEVPPEHLVSNQVRMAYKHLASSTWADWLQVAAARFDHVSDEFPEGLWTRSWLTFQNNHQSALQERKYLHAQRTRDEFWYAHRFGLGWPRLTGTHLDASGVLALHPSPSPHPSTRPFAVSASPSPPPTGTLSLVSPTPQQTLAIATSLVGAGPHAVMPELVAEAKVTGIFPDPTPNTQFNWTITVTFNASGCGHGPNRQINPAPIHQTSTGGRLAVVFPWIRGGSLNVSVSTTIGGHTLTAQSQGVRIVGTNPPAGSIAAVLANDTVLTRIAHLESDCRQFDAAAAGGTSACPLWSIDNAGGVGIMQLTNPAPTDDQVWDWVANVNAGSAVFRSKLPSARSYPTQVQQSHGFQQAVQALNADRSAQGLSGITVSVPNFTESGTTVSINQLGQVELDAIRGYNGWAGRDAFGLPLHEFRLAFDTRGLLTVDIPPGKLSGTARWEQVPAASRPAGVGDPDYVSHVLASPQC